MTGGTQDAGGVGLAPEDWLPGGTPDPLMRPSTG